MITIDYLIIVDIILSSQIALGTVTNVDEAVKWLSYTYLHVRMRLNPMAYGVIYKHMEEDPSLEGYRRKLIIDAGNQLDKVVHRRERKGEVGYPERVVK